MGDRYYSQNQHNSFRDQNYGYRQSQQPMSNLFDMGPAQGSSYSVNTRIPAYNTGSSYNHRSHSGFQETQHSLAEEIAYRRGSQQYNDEQSPPSYEESRNDLLRSRSNTNFNTQTMPNVQKRYSPAWDYVKDLREEPNQNRFSDLFDKPGNKVPPQKSLNWYNDKYKSSQTYQRESQGEPESYGSSSQPHSAFSSNYRDRVDNRYETSGRQTNKFIQNYKSGSVIQNKNRGRGGRGFRGRGYRQNSGRGVRGSHTDGGSWKRRDDKMNSNPEGIKPCSEDVDSRNEEERFKNQEGGSGDEGSEEDGNDDDEWEKGDVFLPDPSLVNKYEYYPPSPEEMGEMFKDLVIYFFFKVPKNKKEANPFVVICESFRRSSGFSELQVEDGYDVTYKDRKFCTLKYQGMMMVRGVGENSNLKEPRVFAGVELINKLAMSCYTLEAKEEYFSDKALQEQLKRGDVPGAYRFAPQSALQNHDTAFNYLMEVTSNEESDEEHIFKLPNEEAFKLRNVAKRKGFHVRVIDKKEWIGICRHRTTQYWRDKILASGQMENEKFVLKPPQGIGNLLLPNFDIQQAISGLKHFYVEHSTLTIYGPQGVGPTIRNALPPWYRRRGNQKTKKNRKKEQKIIEQFRQGVPLGEIKRFKHLTKKQKKGLKKKLSL